MAEFRVQDFVAAQHPSLSGHFPGQPIVPGVVLLQRVAAALHAQRHDLRIEGISLVKFLQPLQPQQSYTIVLQIDDAASVKFRCETDGRLLAQGTLITSASQ